MNPTTFPTDLPVAQVTALIKYLRGQGGDLKTTIFNAYIVEGYALGMTLGQPSPFLAAAMPPPVDTKEGQATALEAVIATHKAGTMAANAVPSWLLPLALKILQDLLAALAGGG